MPTEKMIQNLRAHAERIARTDDPDTATALRWAANDLARLRASHDRLLEALRDLDTLMDFDAPADHCPCWPNPGGLNRVMKKARAAIAAAEEAPPVNRWRHKKRGSTYVEVGRGHLQISWPVEDMEPMVIYRSDSDGSLWARPVVEFEDGRFEAIAAAEGVDEDDSDEP